MIIIRIHKDGMDIAGHAGAGPPGHDIVCAAVSALAQNCVKSIYDLTEDTILYRQDNGYLHIGWNIEDLGSGARLLLDSLFLGLCAISRSYPDNLRVCGPEDEQAWNSLKATE